MARVLEACGRYFLCDWTLYSLDSRITHLLVELSRLQQGYCFWSPQNLVLSCNDEFYISTHVQKNSLLLAAV